MANPIAKTVWEAYEKWDNAQGNLELYQRQIREVEERLRSLSEEQRQLFDRLVAIGKPPEKPKGSSPVTA